jgi:hypothetical protein
MHPKLRLCKPIAGWNNGADSGLRKHYENPNPPLPQRPAIHHCREFQELKVAPQELRRGEKCEAGGYATSPRFVGVNDADGSCPNE